MKIYDHVCIDVETNGLNHKTCEVVEVSATEYNMSGELGETASYLCCPISLSMPSEVSKLNGITLDMLIGKPSYLRDGVREIIARFVGNRTLVGHNILIFDLKFLKLKPVKIIDTLVMSRELVSGGKHNLGAMCNRLNIKFEKQSAHRAGYDVLKTIELHIKLQNIVDERDGKKAPLPLFNQPKEEVLPLFVISDSDVKMITSMAYSFSRISLFHQCPFKWAMSYVRKLKEPKQDHLVVGSVCHKIAEEAGKWCYRQTIINKIVSFKGRELNFDPKSVFSDPKFIPSLFNGCNTFYDMVAMLDRTVKDYDSVSMPDGDTYQQIINRELVNGGATEPSVIEEIKHIMGKFYSKNDFSSTMNGVVIAERQIALDKNWAVVQDWYGENVFVRGKVDLIRYENRILTIIDYKTSRTMINESDLKNDNQTLTYLLLVTSIIPRTSYDTIVIQINNVRFGKTVSYEVEDIDRAILNAKDWIINSVALIEGAAKDKNHSAFNPIRNNWCDTCYILSDGKCPLFARASTNDIGSPFEFVVNTTSACVDAWKRAEVLEIERKALIKKVKGYIEATSSPIIIDNTAKLNIYTKKGFVINPAKFASLMVSKGYKLSDFIQSFSMTKENFDKFISKFKVSITQDEIDSISFEKSKTSLEALTQKEMEGFENV